MLGFGARATDNYGDFKFDRLDENSGEYVVEISSGQAKKTVAAKLGASINLGDIRLYVAWHIVEAGVAVLVCSEDDGPDA